MTENSKTTQLVTRWIPYFLAAFPVVTGFLYVHLFGVNMIWMDEWDMVNAYNQISSGRSPILALWEPHNEHRFFFPSIAILLLATLTDWNTTAEMYLIQICLLVTLIVLLLVFRASIRARPIFFVPVAFLVFSLVQGFSMLWGMQLTFVFVETFAVLTFFFLCLSGRRGLTRFAFPAALLGATIAAFSAIQGLLVWPAGLLQLFTLPVEKSKKGLLLAVWSSVGLGEWILYFSNYTANPNAPSIFYSLTHPIAGTRYFLTLLGSSLVTPRWESLDLVVGLLLASLVTVSLFLIYKSGRAGEYSFWMALLLFSLLVLIAITLGRSGSQDSAAQRYANFSILSTVSVYAILARHVLEDRSRAVVALFGTLGIIMLLSIPASYYMGVKAGHNRENSRQQAAYVLQTYRSQPDKCLQLARRRNTYTVKIFAPELERLGYTVFSEPQISPPRHLRCS